MGYGSQQGDFGEFLRCKVEGRDRVVLLQGDISLSICGRNILGFDIRKPSCGICGVHRERVIPNTEERDSSREVGTLKIESCDFRLGKVRNIRNCLNARDIDHAQRTRTSKRFTGIVFTLVSNKDFQFVWRQNDAVGMVTDIQRLQNLPRVGVEDCDFAEIIYGDSGRNY